MEPESNTYTTSRLGFHYYPDTFHYREHDLQIWLPQLNGLGARWLICRSEAGRAIPEYFIEGLIASGIQPVIQFNLPLANQPDKHEISLLLESYARWGVKYVGFYERPNSPAAWPQHGWAQQNLVERYLDRFLPLAEAAAAAQISPVFSPLEPGGSFWDTAFLRMSLQSMERRGQTKVLDNLVLSTYAWTHQHPLDWGAGGPERWPDARPYFTPEGFQDQRGFRIFDWYQAVAQAVLQKSLPIFLFQAGLPGHPETLSTEACKDDVYTRDCQTILQLLDETEAAVPQDSEDEQAKTLLEPLPAEILACNFWLLAAPENSPAVNQAWFKNSGPSLPISRSILGSRGNTAQTTRPARLFDEGFLERIAHPIQHYVLLPLHYKFNLEAIWSGLLPFINKYHPTIGFSVEEAQLAMQVTVIGGYETIPDEIVNRLRKSGCKVERISADGTRIATILAER